MSPFIIVSSVSLLGLMHVLSCFSCVPLFETLWTVACHAPGSSRQEYWSGLPCPPPGDHLDLGIELTSALHADSLPLSHLGCFK